MTPRQLIDRIAGIERGMEAAQAEQLRCVAAFAAAQLAADVAAGIEPRLAGRSVAVEVACARGVAPSTGRFQVELAQQAAADHPRMLGLLASGRVSLAGLRTVVEETAVLDSAQRREVDHNLAGELEVQRLTPGQLRDAAGRQVIGADPTAAMKRCARERKDRRISVLDKHDGTAAMWAKLPAEQALAVHEMLDAEGRAMRAAGDERSLTELMCDVFVHRLTSPRAPALPLKLETCGDVDGPAGSPRSRALRRRLKHRRTAYTTRRVEVQVVFAASTLLGVDDAPATLRGYGAIPAELARRIAADPDAEPVLRRLLCDPIDGRLLAMDAQTRCFEGVHRKFGIWRDQHSRFPYSSTRIADLDHVRKYASGGSTTAGNGQGLDKGSHVLRDHPGVAVTAMPTTTLPTTTLPVLRANAPNIRWTLPTGHTYDSRPPPAMGWGGYFCVPPKAKPDTWSPLETKFELALWRHRLTEPPRPHPRT